MATESGLMTVEELYRRSGDLGRCELLDGRLVELPYRTLREARALTRLAWLVGDFAGPARLGEVLLGDTGVILHRSPDRVRAPSLCFIPSNRLLTEHADDGYLDVAPDLIVELVSPLDTTTDFEQKAREWLQAGARVVWALNPSQRTVTVWTRVETRRVLREGNTLTGEPVLPGFTVAVADLFA